MKFIPLYLLTLIIARDDRVEGVGELSEDDLRSIADRLYPAECSRLLSYLPDTRGTSRTRFAEHRGYRDGWVTENSRMQCLESLYECNQRGKTVGCTRNWLEAALRKLGRADLVARLRKRKVTRKAKRKNARRESKTPRAGRGDEEPGRNHEHCSRKKAVTSHVRGARKKAWHEKETTGDSLGRRLIIFVVAGSILVLVLLGCTVVVSYRRACRCYNDYLRLNCDERDEKRCSFDKSFAGGSSALEESNKTRRPSTSEVRYTKLVLESDKGKTDDLLWSDDRVGPSSVGRTKVVSFDSAEEETDDERCNCAPVEVRSRRTVSPCAKIKRFFDSQKRHLLGEEDTFIVGKRGRRVSERMKIAKSCGERSVTKKSIGQDDSATRKFKNDRKKTGKYVSGRGRRANRERSRKYMEASKRIGCSCEMCKLFDVTGEGGCNERTVERQRMTRRRKS